MTWDEFLSQPISPCLTGQVQTDINCPECGRKIYYDSTIILTSYPAMYKYWCACGWHGYGHCKPPVYAPDTNVGKWIPCSERLPEEDGNYLVTVHWKGKPEVYVYVDYFQFGCMWDDCGDDVIAWMPLPEPARLEEQP